MTKFHKDWAKIVDFLIKAHFSMYPIFFAPDFMFGPKKVAKSRIERLL